MFKIKNANSKILFLLGFCGVLISTLMLTGCGESKNGDRSLGPSQPLEDIVFSGGDYFVTSDVGNLTNQEIFDLMLETPNALFALLDLIDEVMLRGSFEIDEENTVDFLEEFKADVPDFETWMVQAGFETEADILRVLELNDLRFSAVQRLITVTADEVQAAFDEWVGESDEFDFEDFRDDIYDFLVNEAVEALYFEELARLRYETGLEIFDERLEQAYENYLEMAMLDIETNPASTPSSSEVIARVNEVDITIGQLFAILVQELGIDIAMAELDEEIIDDDTFEALLEPSEDRLKEIYEELELAYVEMNERLVEEADTFIAGSHILVDDYDFAVELIAQLEDADDFFETFIQLAAAYSRCPSGERAGGDLGAWNRGQMVEPFDDAIFDLEKGAFTLEPVETNHGYHIIYRPEPSELPEFEDIREDLIAGEITRQLQAPGVLNEIFMNLRQEANVTFTHPAVQARFQSLMNN